MTLRILTLGLFLWAVPPVAAQVTDSTAKLDLPPVGYGTLRTDDVAIRLDAGNIALKILPLDERVSRLLAPDSYRGMHELVESRQQEISSEARRAGSTAPTLFLVTVFGVENQTRFVPEQITLISSSRYFRPIAVLPVSPRWGEHRVDQRETATALFLFDEGVEVFEPLTVQYGGAISTSWERTLRRLESERARVEARAKRPSA